MMILSEIKTSKISTKLMRNFPNGTWRTLGTKKNYRKKYELYQEMVNMFFKSVRQISLPCRLSRALHIFLVLFIYIFEMIFVRGLSNL